MAQTPAKIDDLTAWTVLGADQDKLLQEEGSLELSANAQLFRNVTGNRIMLQIESSPVFGAVTTELPVLELGDAALTFLRSGTTGKLVLVPGNNPALQLPFEIALDAAGHSEQPLAITFSRLGETIAVSVQGQTLQFPGGPAVGSQEIVLSAGATQSWVIQGLSVVGESTIAETESNKAVDFGEQQKSRTQRAREQSTAAPFINSPVFNGEESSSTDPDLKTENKPARKRVRLELFTPPVVRHGRAHQVRQAAMKVTQK